MFFLWMENKWPRWDNQQHDTCHWFVLTWREPQLMAILIGKMIIYIYIDIYIYIAYSVSNLSICMPLLSHEIALIYVHVYYNIYISVMKKDLVSNYDDFSFKIWLLDYVMSWATWPAVLSTLISCIYMFFSRLQCLSSWITQRKSRHTKSRITSWLVFKWLCWVVWLGMNKY